METFLPSILLVLALGAWVSIEERVFPILRLREPLVSATLAGAILGQPWSGLGAGAVMQALWLLLVPSGGNLLPSTGLAGVVAGAVTAWGALLLGAAGLFGNGRPIIFGLLFGLVAADWGRRWEGRLRRANEAREEAALRGAEPLRASLLRARRAVIRGALARGWIVTGFTLAAAGFLYRAILKTRGFEPTLLEAWGAKLPLTAIGLGVGALGFSLRGGRRAWIELALGVGLGCVIAGGLLP